MHLIRCHGDSIACTADYDATLIFPAGDLAAYQLAIVGVLPLFGLEASYISDFMSFAAEDISKLKLEFICREIRTDDYLHITSLISYSLPHCRNHHG